MRRRRRIGTKVALIAAFATVSSALVGLPTSASAAPSSLTLNYTCDYPLLGLQDIKVDMTVDVPAEVQKGVQVPALNITATTTIPAETTEGLRSINAAKLTGFAMASSYVTAPDFPAPDVIPRIGLTETAVPESGSFPVSAAGKTPPLTFPSAGWGQINVGNIELRVTPKDAAGNNTSLGTLTVQCYQKPGQKNSLAQFYISDGTPAPPKPAPTDRPTAQPPIVYPKPTYDPNVNTLNLVYTCPFPGTGNMVGALKVKAQVDFPKSVKVNEHAPRIKIVSANEISPDVVDAIVTAQGVKLQGVKAAAKAELTIPQYTNKVDATVTMPVGDLDVPQDFPSPPMQVNANGEAPAMVFTKAGPGVIKVANIVLTATPLKADGTPTSLGTIVSDCVQDPAGQSNSINFTIEPGNVVKPGPVTGLGADGEATETSIPVKWTAPSGGADSYEVTANGQTKSTTDTKFTVDGLEAGKSYDISVVAVKAGAKSDPTSVTLKTKDPQAQPPGPVTGLAGDGDPTQTSIPVKWTAPASGADSYEVTANGQTKSTTDTKFTVDGLEAGKSYDISVVAVKGGLKSSATSVTLSTKAKDPEAPGPVTDLGADGAATETSIPVKWTAPASGADSYEVTANGQTKSTTDTKFTVDGLEAGKSYEITVVAVKGGLKSGPTSVTLKTKDPQAQPPGPVTGLAGDGDPTQTSIPVKWTAPASGADSYEVTANGQTKSTTDTKFTVDGLEAGKSYDISVVAVKGGLKSSATSVTLSTKAKDPEAPGPVTDLGADGAATETSIPVKWTAPASGADSYEVTANGKTESTTATKFNVTGLEAGKSYEITVVAVKGGLKSGPTKVTLSTAPARDITAPSNPADLKGDVSGSTATLTWTASKDEDGGSGLAGYYLYQNGQKQPTLITEAKKVLSGLAAGDYTFEVSAVDKAGNESGKSAPVKVTIAPPTGGSTYTLAGSSAIKGANGKVNLSGSVTSVVEGGKVSADLTLNPTTGNFSIFGFIPATASITFAPQGKTTGTLSGTNLSTETKTIVKVPTVKVFGMEVGGGTTCQTGVATIPLKSTDFSQGTGGTLKGTYTLPALTGCGPLTPIISALVAGPGNTVDLKATAKK